jgi:hypothetical protein
MAKRHVTQQTSQIIGTKNVRITTTRRRGNRRTQSNNVVKRGILGRKVQDKKVEAVAKAQRKRHAIASGGW